MNKKLKALAAGAMLVASSYAAADVNIGGLTVPTGPHFEVASIYENVITSVGQELRGVGEITQINGTAVGSLCSNCELTYRFGGYTVTSVTATNITFSGGYINFYLGFGAQNDFNPFTSPSSTVDLAAATNGTLFLTLSGHAIDALGNTFSGTGTNLNSAFAVGFGGGLGDVDVTGAKNGNTAGPTGIANSNFNTNSIAALFGGFADFSIDSSFGTTRAPHPTECTAALAPTAAECLAGSASLSGLVIPEPDSVALLGLGVAALALGLRRRRAAK